jgi:Lrp/AsnC family transcriptional regulator for asnA, asnC and gidA
VARQGKDRTVASGAADRRSPRRPDESPGQPDAADLPGRRGELSVPDRGGDTHPETDSPIRDASGRLDERSKRIIEQLQEDARRSYAAIARAVGLSEAATRLRVQRLLEEGVVQIAAVTRAEAVGFHRQAMLGVRVEGDVRGVAQKLGNLPEAEYVVVCAGQYDLLVELVCEDDEHLLDVIDNGVRSVPGVRSTETFVYLRVEKESYQWGTR